MRFESPVQQIAVVRLKCSPAHSMRVPPCATLRAAQRDVIDLSHCNFDISQESSGGVPFKCGVVSSLTSRAAVGAATLGRSRRT